MKKKLKIVLFVTIGLVVLIVLFSLINQMKREKEDVVAFQYSYSGAMVPDAYRYYSATNINGGKNVLLEGNKGLREDVSSTSDPRVMEDLNKIVNKYNIYNWVEDYDNLSFMETVKVLLTEGFDGLRWMGVMATDLPGYKVSITYSDGTVVTSKGYGVFPKNFSEASDDIEALFEKELGIY